MKVLNFSGFSNDIFGCAGDINVQYNTYGKKKPIPIMLEAKEGKMLVVGEYDRVKNRCWVIGVCNVNIKTPLPNWIVEFLHGDYTTSPILRIYCPEDVSVFVCD